VTFIYDSPVALFLVKWVAILACDAGTLLLIFVPKVYILRTWSAPVDPLTATMRALAVDPNKGSSAKGAVDQAPPGVDLNEELRQENEELREKLYRLYESLEGMESAPQGQNSPIAEDADGKAGPTQALRGELQM